MRLIMGKWLKAHWKAVLAHSFVLSGFLFYCIFLSAPLFDRFEAIGGEAKLQNIVLPAESENVQPSIEVLEVSAHVIEVQGSAFIDGQSSDNSQIYIVLKSDHKYYVFNATTQWRGDVTSRYGSSNLNLDWSGFICIVPSRKISNGEYVIGIYIKNGDIEAFRCTDRVVAKS